MKTGSWGVKQRGTRVTDATIASVLVVDDDATKRLALEAALAPLGLPIVQVDSGLEALRCVMEQDFAVILLDVRMPEMDGFETAALIRRRKESEMTPIIFITAFAGDELGPKSKYVSGAVDFMFAPIPPDELRAKVSVFVNLYLQAAAFAARADEVQASADHLKLLTDTAPIGIFRTDADNRFVYTNPRWSEISGVGWQDALDRDWEGIIGSPQSLGAVFDDSSLTSGDAPSGHRFELALADGTSRVVLSTSEPVHDLDGVISGWVGTLADVTAETRAEQEQSRFRALVQNARDVILVIDEEGRVAYVSPGLLEVAGFTPEELVGSMGIDSIHPDDVSAVLGHLAEIIQSPHSVKTVEARSATKSRGWIWVEIRAVNRLTDPSIQGIVINYHDITERRDSTDRLAQSEKMLAEGQALSHLGSFTWDMRSDEMYWSDESYRLLGFQPGSVTARLETFLDRLHPGDRAEFSQMTEASARTGAPFERDLRSVLPDGTIRWLHFRGQYRLEADVAVSLTAMIHDITARREAEKERLRLLDQQKDLADRLRTLLDSTGEGIYGVDAQGVCTFMNAAGATLLGAPADHFVGRSMHELMHHTRADGTDYPASECPIVQGILDGAMTRTRGELVWRCDGTSFPADYSSYPIGGEGSADGAVVAFQDVTQRQEMERELRQSERLFRGAFDAAQTGIALIDPDGLTYLDVNDALCEMLGYTKPELIKLDWRQLTHPDDLAANLEAFGRFAAGRSEVHYINKRYLRKNGEAIQVEIVDSVLRGAEGEPMVWVVHVNDVTERDRAARENERLEGELVQSQKMEAVGLLAGGIAHDFNNLLSVILNYARFASEGLEPGDERRADIDEIGKAGERAAELVHQLLAFSRKEVIEQRDIDMNEIVGGIQQMLARSLGEDIALEFDGLPGLPAVLADPGRVEQVLLNLAVNARDAMPDGGTLEIKTSVGPVELDEYPGLVPGNYVVVTVKDTGAGMDESTADRIFEPFFTTKPRGEGTGMGLSSSYGIIEQAGGRLGVRSELGMGTTFSIHLPVSDGSPVEVVHHEDTYRSVTGTETILLVEDEDAVRDLVSRILRKGGYEVVPYSTGSDALEYCRTNDSTIHLLLTDVVMPKMSGQELSQKATEIVEDLKTLFMSGYTDDLIAQRGVLVSGENLIAKPFSPDELLGAIRTSLDVGLSV